MSILQDLRDLSPDQLAGLMESYGERPFRVRQLMRWLWREPAQDFAGLTDLPRNLRNRLTEDFHLRLWRPETEQRSADGTRKFLFRLGDGQAVETVMIPERDHSTLCVSSQVGCRMGCRFCRTGRGGLVRNLTSGEILHQILFARESALRELPLTNLVFMGMGEPLDNYDNLITALDITLDTAGFGFGRRRVTVSTAGLAPMIERLGQDSPVSLALSLNAADDELRSELMPINRRYPLSQLKDVLAAHPLTGGRRITIEYVLLKGINDSVADAKKLVKFLHGLLVKINLIPFNPLPGFQYGRPDPEDVDAFQAVLHAAKFTAPVRRSMGADIAAACGQLAADADRS